jgi:uncharacterized membrane protein YfcA
METRQTPLLEEQAITVAELDTVDISSSVRRERLDSVSTVSSTCSTVSIRNGFVRDIRQKKKIPELNKAIALITICLLVFVAGPVIYYSSQGRLGLFRQSQEEEDVYEHEKKIEWDAQDIAGFIFASLMITIAAGGGIGGGGVLVPTYIFILGFEPKYAIPLSNCTILGSSISNLVLNVCKRHEYADRPLIDWDIMLMMEPLTVAGALVGTFVNVISPPWLITIMLVLLLTATAIKTLKKGVKKYKQESEKFARQATLASMKMDDNPSGNYAKLAGDVGDPTMSVAKKSSDEISASTVLGWAPADVKEWWQKSLPSGCQEYIYIVDECELDGADLMDLDYISLQQYEVKKMHIMKILRRIKQMKQSLGMTNMPSATSMKDGTSKTAQEEEHRSSNDDLEPIPEGGMDPRRIKADADGNAMYIDLLQKESVHPPWKVGLMFLCCGGILTFTILKGGGDINPLDLQCGETAHWIITLVTLPWVLIISYIARQHLVNRFAQKKECGYEYLPQDIRWDSSATIRYPLICSTAGLAAGMFGVGGGIVKGPLMLEMNVFAPVTSATSATMILFTSSGASVSYLLFQQLNLNYGAVLFCLGMFWTFFGQIALNKAVKASGRNSYIILLIGLTVALSAIAMGYASSEHLTLLLKGEAESGGDICGAGGE